MPTVSICIPTYNRKEYLREALDSVFVQTYKDYEVVIVDDGSTDGTGEMIKSAGYDVRYYWQENRGEAAARNKLIEFVRGQYISFLDSDDLLIPDAVERMVKVMEAEGNEIIVYGTYLRIDQNGCVCGKSKRKLYSGYITKYLFEDIFIHSCGSMFPKKVLVEAGGFDKSMRVCSVYDLLLRLSLKYRFVALAKPTFKRRRHSSNTSQNSFANRKTELDVLTDFYYNGGGKEVIPKHLAMKRISKESYRAGRWAIKEGLYNQACELLSQSFQQHPNPKSLIHWARATAKRLSSSYKSKQELMIPRGQNFVTCSSWDRKSREMNLLVLSSNIKRASFRQRIGVYLDTLSKNGINCEVAQLSSSSISRRKLFKKVADFDGVFLQKKCLNFFDAFWLRRYSKKIIYDFDDAVMYSPKLPDSNRVSHFNRFRRIVKLADLVIAGNSYLAEHAKEFNTRVEVLPTGLCIKDYNVQTKLKNDGRIRLVWIGSKSTLRYLAEIKSALEEVGSRFENVTLRIIADEFLDFQRITIEKRKWSQETETVDLAISDIGLAPLPDNRFTRGKCAFKILQYAAAGLPVVVSPVGTNVDYVRDGVTGFFATDLNQWVDKINILIKDQQLRETMGLRGRAYTQQLDLSVIGKRLCEIISNCIGTT